MHRTIRFISTVALAAGLLGLLSGCGTNDAATSCQTHEDCDRGEYCAADFKCAEKECSSLGDCEGVGVVCLVDLGLCSAKECDVPADCGAGMTCQSGTCIADATPTPDVVGGPDGEAPPDIVVEPDVPVVDNVTACTACDTDADCGDMSCEQVGLDKACVPTCVNDADCGAGWLCYPLTNEGKFCIPSSSQCTATCLSEGCAAGQVCDQVDGSVTFGQCVPAKAQCEVCTYDWQCGAGSRCATTVAAFKFCMPECYDGQCDGWATCGEMGGTGGDGVMVCKPNNASCCGPDSVCGAECTPACGGNTPICLDGLCVECAVDGDCVGTGVSCDPMIHQCVGGCYDQPSTPYEYNGQCVQCLIDSHCTGGTCDPVSHTCAGGDPCGGACVAPYPGCAVINGVPSCVPCTEDVHCPGSTCDTAIFQCAGSGTANCNQDCLIGGCPLNTQYDLGCDPQSGCCFDRGGLCDNTVAYCNEARNSECKSIFEIFAGGMMPTLPGMEGGEFVGGMCTCDSASSALCNLLPDNPLCDAAIRCYEGINCLPIGTLMQLLMGLGGGGGGAVLLSGDFCTKLF